MIQTFLSINKKTRFSAVPPKKETGEIFSKRFDLDYCSKYSFLILFLVLWNHSLFSYFRVIYSRIPVIGKTWDIFQVLLFFFLSLLSLPKIIQSIKPGDVFFTIFFFLIFSISYINNSFFDIVIYSFPMYFLGLYFCNIIHTKVIVYLSRLTIFLEFIYRVFVFDMGKMASYSIANFGGDLMTAAHYLLPHACLITVTFFQTKKKIDLFLLLLSLFLFVSFSNRASLLNFFICLIFCCFFYCKSKREHIYQFFVVFLLFIGIISNIDVILNWLVDMISNIGLSTRTVFQLSDGLFFHDNGRSFLTGYFLNNLNKIPLLGYGMGGDRIMLGDNRYMHNLLLEFIVSYGLFAGILFFVILLSMIVNNIIKLDKMVFINAMYLSLFFGKFLILFFSGTYLTAPFFYFFLGMTVSLYRIQNKNLISLLKK